jgi:hypothetical protein
MRLPVELPLIKRPQSRRFMDDQILEGTDESSRPPTSGWFAQHKLLAGLLAIGLICGGYNLRGSDAADPTSGSSAENSEQAAAKIEKQEDEKKDAIREKGVRGRRGS